MMFDCSADMQQLFSIGGGGGGGGGIDVPPPPSKFLEKKLNFSNAYFNDEMSHWVEI